jgi:Leucine-rich repeat (LRR) protein
VVEKKAMKALIILLIVVFSIIFRPTVCWAAPPYQEFKTFKDWCLNVRQLPEGQVYWKEKYAAGGVVLTEFPSPKETVLRLIKESDADNCDAAQEQLLQRKELDLSRSLEDPYVVSPVLNDVRPLATLTNLEKLNLAGNQIKNISSLAGLTNLKQLNLSKNKVKDLSPLKNLINLEELDIYDNWANDLTPLSNLKNLIKLKIGEFNYEPESLIDSIPEEYNYDENYFTIRDFSHLGGLNKLQSLAIKVNSSSPDSNVRFPIRDYSFISKLSSLKNLEIDDGNMQNANFLDSLTNLEVLKMPSESIYLTQMNPKLKKNLPFL